MGFKKRIPAIVKTDLSEEEAYVYVIETNLMQRSFSDLMISEKAAVLKARYEKESCQGRRNDIIEEGVTIYVEEFEDYINSLYENYTDSNKYIEDGMKLPNKTTDPKLIESKKTK